MGTFISEDQVKLRSTLSPSPPTATSIILLMDHVADRLI
jgi:hypothetical protein